MRNKLLASLALSVSLLPASLVVAADSTPGSLIDSELRRAIQSETSRTNERRMHVAMMLRDQGFLGDAYSHLVYSYGESQNRANQARLLYMAGWITYEISGFEDANSYAWRTLIEENGGEKLANKAWQIISESKER